MPPVFRRNFQSAVLFAPASPSSFALRGCHPLRRPVPRDFMSGRSGGPGPHISMRSPARIRLALFRFRSPLLTESLLFSFPLPTKMLQFGRLPFPKGITSRLGGPIRQSPVQRLLAPTRSNIAAWHDLHRLPSRAIPHLACSNTAEVSYSIEIDFGTLLSPGCVCTVNRFWCDACLASPD
jgi:hypothetical protein